MQSQLQNCKFFGVTPPAAIIDNASATCNVIDTLGFDHVRIFVYLGAMDIAAVALKVQEANVAASATALTSGADVTGLVYGTSTNLAGSVSALPTASSDNTCFVFDVCLATRKRYLLPVITLGDGSAGTYVTAFALLSRAEQTPVTAAGQGAADVLAV